MARAPPTLTLPCLSGKLILRGVGAGSREFLRASVDYDGIEAKELDRFNSRRPAGAPAGS